MSQQLVGELKQESATTRRVLERVPSEKLEWRPHRTSMTLGQLAMHVASIPDAIAQLAQRDGFDASQANFEPAQPKRQEGDPGRLRAQRDVSRRAICRD